jgi:uncharacterized protein (PEP-CTERM system associated)
MGMAITAMDMTKKINKNRITAYFILLSLIIEPATVLAGDWQLTPILKLDETFSNNIELVNTSYTPSISSFVTQTVAGLDAEFNSSLSQFKLSSTQTYYFYSTDSELNDTSRTLNANGQYIFWDSGLILTANAKIANVNKNNANNSLGDVISSDTVQTETYATGLQYNIVNSSYSVKSSLNYNIKRAEDNIGEYDGVGIQISSKNGKTARNVYWQTDGSYTKRKQSLTSNEGENYNIEALLGAITSWNLNPFIRYYDENVQGTGVSQDLDTTSSLGPGLRWLATPHIIVDLSYNFTANEAVSDDYIDTSIEWEPSVRTSLTLGYSQRFFGDSYNFNLKHKTRRLTNTLIYDESLEVFDRNSYQETTTGELELIENNEFSLNKRLTWSSQLQLSRTSFGLSVSSNERTNLETNIKDATFDTNINITRTISPKSTLSLTTKFNYLIYDKDDPEGSRQEDYYRTISARFSRNLASSLLFNFTVQHVNRSSTNDILSYKEVRAIMNIKKEF